VGRLRRTLCAAHGGALAAGSPGPVPTRAGGAGPLQPAYRVPQAYAEAQVLAAQDRKLLAIDVVKMLLPPSLDSIPATSLVLSDAVRGTRVAAIWYRTS